MKKKLLMLSLVLILLSACGVTDTTVPVQQSSEKEVSSYTVTNSIYTSNNYHFRAKLWPNFQVEYLPDGAGFALTRATEADIKVKQKTSDHIRYTVYISLSASENIFEYPDLSAMLEKKYKDYSLEFLGDGVFVNESNGTDAIRHYFLMSKDMKIIYEAYLTVPAPVYPRHKQGFDDFVKTIEVF